MSDQQQSDAQRRFGEAWISAALCFGGVAGGLFAGIGTAPTIVGWSFGYVMQRLTGSHPFAVVNGVTVGGLLGLGLYITQRPTFLLIANSDPVLWTGYLLLAAVWLHTHRCWRAAKLDS